MTTLADTLSNFTKSLRYETIPKKTVHELKRRVIDSLGCAMGAYHSEPVRIVREMGLHIFSPYGATLFGKDHKTTPDFAAFSNGLLIRYLDYNDTYLSLEPAHPSDNLSAVLAIAEAEHRNGKTLLTALLAAYEIQCRLCDSASLRSRGWDHVVYGVFSSSLAAAKLMDLTREEMVHVLGIAGVANNALRQTRVGELSMWKGAAFANAARNGVFSALLVKHGMTGPASIFEGEKGFFNLISGPIELTPASFGGEIKPFRIMESYIKYYPAEYHSQSAIGAALEIRPQVFEEGGLEGIDSILIKTPQASFEIIGSEKQKWAPKSRETADHSLPYLVGIALIDGKVETGQFSDDRILDEKVLKFLKKIQVVRDKEMDQEYPEGVPNEVSIFMKSGKTFSKKILYPKGHPKNPLTDEEVERKFKTLGKDLLNQQKLNDILDTLWNLEKLEDSGTLLNLFKQSSNDGL
ncbi:MAG: MmgE/PrpD family protein [Nitrospirae bacterium]|nr:MmgE/PrpD family protein [Nitrospirota bacterium]